MTITKSPVLRNREELENWYTNQQHIAPCVCDFPNTYPCIAVLFLNSDNKTGPTEMMDYVEYSDFSSFTSLAGWGRPMSKEK